MKPTKWFMMLLPLLLTAAELYADAALLLQQPYSTYGAYNPTGHIAIYLSRVCAASPTELRRCNPGEEGVVISRYRRIASFDWIAIPLMPYLYAVERPDQVPVSIDREGIALLRNLYRRAHLRTMAPDAQDGQTPKGDWTQLIGAAYDRKIYGFMIETHEAADDALIQFLNSSPNKRRFNILYRNCADFAKSILNFYYPKAVRRSILADAGIATPKQIAKSLVQFSKRRLDLQFSALVIPQIHSDLKRSKPVRGVLEALIRSKKYAVPLAVIYPWVAVGGGVAYISGGRFDPEKHVTSVYEPNSGFKSASRAEAKRPEPAESDAQIAADLVTAGPVPEIDPNWSLISD